MKNWKIAILGISGNPIHNAHLELATAAEPFVDEVWIMPCWNHMFNKDLASPDARLEMCRLATAGLEKIKVSDFDIKNQLTCGTYESLKKLEHEYFVQPTFYFVIGQDNADTIEKWRNYQKLLNEFTMIVVPRKGYIPSKTWYNDSKHLYLKDCAISDVSSTQIRQGLALKDKSVEEFLHPDVFKYIQNYGLYQQ